MKLEDTIIAGRRITLPIGVLNSFVGVSYEDKTGARQSFILFAEDPNISLKVTEIRDPRGAVVFQLCYYYAGRCLADVIDIGDREFQVFRLHWHLYYSNATRETWDWFGEPLFTKANPNGSRETLSFEQLHGPRLEDWQQLRRWAFNEQPAVKLVRECPRKVTPTVEEFMANPIYVSHPGLMPLEADREQELVTHMRLYEARDRYLNPQVM